MVKGYDDYFFPASPWRAPPTPRAPPRSRGLRGPRYATAPDILASTFPPNDCNFHMRMVKNYRSSINILAIYSENISFFNDIQLWDPPVDPTVE